MRSCRREATGIEIGQEIGMVKGLIFENRFLRETEGWLGRPLQSLATPNWIKMIKALGQLGMKKSLQFGSTFSQQYEGFVSFCGRH